MEDTNLSKMSSLHMYSWKLGLKTSSYYVHSLPATKAANVVSNENTCESCSA